MLIVMIYGVIIRCDIADILIRNKKSLYIVAKESLLEIVGSLFFYCPIVHQNRKMKGPKNSQTSYYGAE